MCNNEHIKLKRFCYFQPASIRIPNDKYYIVKKEEKKTNEQTIISFHKITNTDYFKE